MIVKFFSLTSDVSKITNRLVIQKGLEIQFKAESADFRNDPQKMNFFWIISSIYMLNLIYLKRNFKFV